MCLINRLIPLIILFSVSECYGAKPVHIGDVSKNILGLASGITDVIFKLCYVIGIALFVGSLMQFKEHRDRPANVRISQPLMMLVFGFAIIMLPILASFSESAKGIT